MSGKIASSKLAADVAAAKLTGIDTTVLNNQRVEFSGSTVPSMLTGQKVANHLLEDMEKLTDAVCKKAKLFPQLAEKMEADDQAAAQRLGE